MNYKLKEYNWIWIDAKCHIEMLPPLKIELNELPILVFYDNKSLK